MKFGHIASYVRETPWAITHEKLGDILDVLVARLDGQRMTEAEIQLRVGEVMGRNQAKVEAAAETTRSSGGAVGVIPIIGTIYHRRASMEESSGGTSTPDVTAALRSLVANQEVGTILLDIDSPGGTVTGVPELADAIFAAREQKRIVALCDALAASAGYWLAAQAHEIICVPSGMVGSIGVFTAHEDLSKRAELLGVKVTLISAGKFKTEGNPFEPLSDETKAMLQARVDDAYELFVKAVARGRGVKASEVRNGFGEGRVLTTDDAKAAGMIDRIATRDDAIARVMGARRSAGGGARTRAEDEPASFDDDRARRLRLL